MIKALLNNTNKSFRIIEMKKIFIFEFRREIIWIDGLIGNEAIFNLNDWFLIEEFLVSFLADVPEN